MSWTERSAGKSSRVPWKDLTSEEQVNEIVAASYQKPQLIFKHSTRCSISSMAKDRLEREWNLTKVDIWYLDLLAYRNISDSIASELGVHHESPQVILLQSGKVVHHSSHSAIAVSEIAKRVS